MKNQVKRVLAALCAAALCLGLVPLPALAADHMSFEEDRAIGNGLTVNTLLSKGADGSRRQMFTLDYTPGQAVTPVVGYGTKLYGRSDINYVVDYMQQQGYTVLAAVNADYFNMDTGIPTGMLINNGRLCVSDGAWNAVGFFADGAAMCGTPGLAMSFYRHSTGETKSIYALNKVRTGNGIYLYTEDFSSTTRTSLAGTEVVLECTPGDFLRLGQPLQLQVVAVRQAAGTAIGPNQFVLSLSEANTVGLSISDINVGETITVSASTADPRWHDVVYSCGGGNMLVQNGAITSGAKGGKEPRTVLGVRADGSFSVLVCDGRQTGLSDGLGLLEAAQLMLDKGCVNVINLDGGGSTALSYRDAGAGASALKSSPSEGSLRRCANYIVFVNSGESALPESMVSVYPQSPAMLAGASLRLSGYTYNDDYFPIGAVSSGFDISAGEGSIEGDIFTAPMTGGYTTVDAYAGSLYSVGTTIKVVDAPQVMAFARAGGDVPLSTLAVGTGTSTALEMYVTDGLRRLTAQNSQFEFSVSGNIGSIDAQGVFTSAATPGLSGAITASWNGYTATIPVTVGRAPNVLESFEGEPAYTVIIAEDITGATGTATLSKEPKDARYGVGALILNYKVDSPADMVRFVAAQPYQLTGGANIISLLMKGSGDFGVDFATPDGIQRVPVTLDGQWQYITLDVPAGATAVAGFSAGGEAALAGSVHIDQLMAHYGSAANDVTPPTIEAMVCDGISFAAQISDNYPLPVTKAMISLTIDGVPVAFEYEPDTGIITAQLLNLAPGMHRVSLSVQDYFLNTARQSVVVGQTAETMYLDLDGHWARDYAEYLRIQGVFGQGESFGPQVKVVNEMAATLLSRFLKTDTSKYDHLEMPFADADQISEYAYAHVKAMFYEGVMIGSYDAQGNRIFLPQNETTRAQVMTILGRTLPRGYSYDAAPFGDYAAIPAWAQDHVNLLYSMGIVAGYGATNEVRPLGTITRAEMASLLFKIY